MRNLIYKHEKPLFILAALLSLVIWAGLIYSTKGMMIGFAIGYILSYLFFQSGFISHFRGRGALVSDAQFPDIQQRVKACAEKLGVKKIPEVYILQYDGMLNAFATMFMRTRYIVLMSDILDALENDPDAINFYIGHEMGHLHRHHLEWHAFLIPGVCFPLLGAAYLRAREYTCDLHGAACCSEDAAAKGLAVLGVGAKRYRTLNMGQYLAQTKTTSEFWMSFHELIASYPWLIKRIAAVSRASAVHVPKRNPLAYIPALFIPQLSITTAMFLYLLFLFVGTQALAKYGAAMGLIPPKSSEAAAYTEPDYEGMTNKEVIDATVADWNLSGEAYVDEVTILKSNAAEGDNTLVFNYTIDPVPADYDAVKVTENMRSLSLDNLCNSPGMAFLKDRNIINAHRYFDTAGKKLMEVDVSRDDCPKEEPAAVDPVLIVPSLP